jgi:endonuclease-3
MTCQYTRIMPKITRRLSSKKKPGSKPKPALPSKPAKKIGKASSKPSTSKASTFKAATRPKAPAKSKASANRLTTRPWTPAEVHEAFSRFRQANPEPRGELEHLNPYTLLVAVVLSAQATDAGVNKATRALFAVADTPQKMLALGEDKVRDYIKTIGLYRNKARNVIALSEKLIAEFGGEVPRTRAELESLPGAGRKTANVVLNMAFGEHTMAVDTHVFRVGNRTGLAPGRTPLEVELGLERVIPPEFMLHAHHWLILHGRYTCLARKPRCEVCLINDLCRWPEKTV